MTLVRKPGRILTGGATIRASLSHVADRARRTTADMSR